MKKKTDSTPSRGKSKQSPGAAGKEPRGTRASAQKHRLLADLQEAAGRLDEEGLLFLLQQAQILIHNAEVERINQEIRELQDRQGEGSGRGPGASSTPASSRTSVLVEEGDNGKSFFLQLGGVRKVLSLPEIRRLVKICYAAESKSAALRQLYTVLARERGDILADARIAGPSSALLDGLFYALREKYRLEDR